jgi:fatty acid desaturase
MNAPETFTTSPQPDDLAMLRAAVDLTRDLAAARPDIYWPDMLLSAALGYAALAGAILLSTPWMVTACGIVAALALYRALLFIHELAHIHRDALPGFRLAWNLLVGIPLLTPSFMYEGVHTLHHARTRYGTVEDPEYLPLGLMKPWTLPLFLLIAVLLPPALLLRCAVAVPLSSVVPPLRRVVWQRFSSLSTNPEFRRRPPESGLVRMIFWQELGASIWAISLLALSLRYGWKPLLIAMAVIALTAVLNQLRTLAAHLWTNNGGAMTVTAQYLDSVNVPPPERLSLLWAPVGLRYHATHHLLPSVPYHALGEAHRRLTAQLGPQSTYQSSNYSGLATLLARLARSTMRFH